MEFLANADSFSRFQGEPPYEDRQAAQEGLFWGREQRVGPIDGGAQGLLARQGGAAAAREQAETIAQPLRDLLDGQRAHARRGKLERQRDAVEPMADPGDRIGILLRDPESRLCRDRPVDEQAHRLVARK